MRILLKGEELPSAESLDAYVVQRKLLDNRRPTFRRDADALVIEAGRSEYFMQAPERFDLVLTAPGAGGPRAWSVSLPLHDRAAATEIAAGKPVSVATSEPYGCSVKYGG